MSNNKVGEKEKFWKKNQVVMVKRKKKTCFDKNKEKPKKRKEIKCQSIQQKVTKKKLL